MYYILKGQYFIGIFLLIRKDKSFGNNNDIEVKCIDVITYGQYLTFNKGERIIVNLSNFTYYEYKKLKEAENKFNLIKMMI